MRGAALSFLFVLAAAFVLALNTFFIVSQTQQAIVLRFGAPQQAITSPGLYVKAPFLDSVQRFDRRNLGLTISQQQIVAADQERLVVDMFVRWRIANALSFYQAATSEEGGRGRLESLAISAMRRVLGSATSNDIIRNRRAELMQAIENDLNSAAAAELGASVIDVRIRQAEQPPTTQERVFERMKTERQQEAARLRAEGGEQATRVRAEADRQVTVIQATARESAEKTRGEGDARRAAIFARAYGADPDFAAFYRSMQAYERALPAGTQMIMPPDGEFFRYMRDKQGTARR
ncbi:MAG: protease modulator HflC [Hyphomonadaceae bacterium]|nr:protease modulator HflC [Hyphomonadaceae bacterium]